MRNIFSDLQKNSKTLFYSLIKNSNKIILHDSTVAQWWSIRLLTEGLQVQVLSVEQIQS